MATIKDIAEAAKLSVSVVSRALNPNPDQNARVAASTRERVEQIARELGFRPDRQAEFLRRGMIATLGVFLPEIPNRLIADLMIGISDAAAEEGFPLNFYFGMTTESYSRFCSRESDGKIRAGMITYPFFDISEEAAKEIDTYRRLGGKVVLLNTEQPISDIPVVRFDEDEGGRLAARQLFSHHCVSYLVNEGFAGRAEGFRDELSREGLDSTQSKDIVGDAISLWQAGIRPLGIFCLSDLSALTALRELSDAGMKVGDDFWLVGYDDLFATAESNPPLTTIHQPFREQGGTAVRMLLSMIYGCDTQDKTITPRLVTRSSA